MLAAGILLPSAPRAWAQGAPEIPAVLLTLEGRVEVAAAGTLDWKPGRTNQLLRPGDRVHTGPRSRATLRLSDLSVLRLNELATLEVRPTAQPGQRLLLDLKAGRSYLFNREKPAELQFRTPLASGAIRGTEFELSVEEATGRTVLTLLEGAVTLNNAQGEIALASGEQGTVEPGQAPRKSPVLDAVSIIQWSLYYPAVVDPDELRFTEGERQALAESLQAYRSGDLLQAVDRLPGGFQPASDGGRLYRAALLLSVGQVTESQAELQRLEKPSLVADALRQVMAAVRQHPGPMPRAPRRGARFDSLPESGTALLAESYHRQAHSDLPGALRAAREAVRKSAGYGGAWVRVAELELGLENLGAALAALERGLALSPRHAGGRALQGYALARQGRTAEAEQAFAEAIALDGGLGHAWLGRGLCRFHRGDPAGGRADLQVAATLEPQRAVLRSYLGKAFAREGDLRRAEKELRLARAADPNDPTSWLYLALLYREENRINEAIDHLEQSKARNDNRSVYRSRLSLDQDQATRAANLAGIYRDAGLLDWSAYEAARAVNDDYANYSAHLFLASSYDALRDPRLINLRYETPWLSEQLLANLLAPAAAGTFPLNVAEEPYTRLFDGNHLGVVNSTEYFSSGEWIQRASHYGIRGGTSWSLDASYHTDPGQRPNNDLEQTALSATVKQQVTDRDSLLLRAETYHGESGDLAQYYDQASASRDQRVHERQEPNVFLGWHRTWAPGQHTLFLGGYLEDNLDFEGSFPLYNLVLNPAGQVVGGFQDLPTASAYETDLRAVSGELQHLWQVDRHTVIVGGRAQGGSVETEQKTPDGGNFDNRLSRYSGYAYWFWRVFQPLQLQAGVSYDYLDYPANTTVPPLSDNQRTEDQWSPKVGFTLQPWTNAVFRGSYTRSLGGLYYDTSVRLEPTTIAGFNQALRSVAPESVVGLVPGTSFETVGFGFEQRFPTRTYLTLATEMLSSEGDRDLGASALSASGSQPTQVRQSLDFDERSVRASVSQLLGERWSAGAAYRLTDSELQGEFPSFATAPALDAFSRQDQQARLQQVTLYANFFSRAGLFAQAWSVWSHQENDGYTPELPTSDFWQHNVAVGWRLPQRRAEVRVSLLNLTDEDYRLNPLTLYRELPRERTLAVSLKFYF
ncbi:MAG: hypothetical protein RJA22_1208 [Verrucomicrobiota bacterium]